MSSGTREIDKIPSVTERPVQMQVLCLGLSRTSTMSLYVALKKLGYNSYHFLELAMNAGEQDVFAWLEGMEAKVNGNGKLFGQAEFDKLLGNYSAVTDIPCVNYYEELLQAYPDAKVILTTRSPETWIASVSRSFLVIINLRVYQLVKLIGSKRLLAQRQIMRLALTHWSGGKWDDREALKAGFVAHNASVRKIVQPGRLLEFSPQDGWKPLCEFLGKDVPDEPYPHINKGDYSAELVRSGIISQLVHANWKPALALAVACLALGLMRFW